MRLSQIHHLVLPQLKKALNWNRMGREIYFHCRKPSLKRCVSKPCFKYGIFIHTSWLSRIKSPLRSRIFVPHYKKKKKKKTYLSSFDHKLRITKLFSVLLVDKLVNLGLIRWLAWILYLSFICLIYLPIFSFWHNRDARFSIYSMKMFFLLLWAFLFLWLLFWLFFSFFSLLWLLLLL